MYNEFAKCHPFVNFLYFLFVISVTVFFNHPVIMVISLVSSLTYSALIVGRKFLKYLFFFIIPMCLLCGALNPVFNHQGMTILMYFQDRNPLTLESIVYGAVSAVLLASVMMWFVCFNGVMDSDKIIYLFGRVVPSLATIITMVMRLVPMYASHFKDVYKVRASTMGNMDIVKKLRAGLASVSSTTTWALENAVYTADSMTSRGYGTGKRNFYSDFMFTKRDAGLLIFLIGAGAVFFVSALSGGGYAMYFPYIKLGENLWLNLTAYVSFGIVSFMPVCFNLWEDLKWRFLK
ncbi:hypothetical protein B5F08_04630 [Anaeromassilibacillus sp. An172]|uniref:energy-coupling factor transporter transmembrane component T n=1 Tax=Anaeromassilibacillus sp. An172 TaxID=1965570 RepID=UPI000B39AAD6|nr:energy-coupling factor transporter transmembrane component T [Anaeromassilibacillus sp. An172]OUP79492.1 hypothetical protein B5F08_04630 [Anaeromassilibacillus sp. An172]